MGSLTYDRVVVDLDDRTLTHVQIVIIQKLRRGESFSLSWKDSAQVGGGRSSVWLNPAIPLYFKFAGGHVPTINPEWLEELTRSAASSQGLIISSERIQTVEPDPLPPPGRPSGPPSRSSSGPYAGRRARLRASHTSTFPPTHQEVS